MTIAKLRPFEIIEPDSNALYIEVCLTALLSEHDIPHAPLLQRTGEGLNRFLSRSGSGCCPCDSYLTGV